MTKDARRKAIAEEGPQKQNIGHAAPRDGATAALPTQPASGRDDAKRITTGVARLDELLDGGFMRGGAVLLSGPRFTNKGQLARRALVANIHGQRAGVLVATSQTAADERERLAVIEPGLADMATPMWIVDTVTRLVGGEETDPFCRYVDGPRDLNGIAAAVQKCLAASPTDRSPVLVIDSVSTLIAYGDPQAAFRFLQVLIGRAHRAGTTTILLVDDDMHEAHDVALVRHLMDGAIETRAGDGHQQMRILGMGGRSDLGWIEYRATAGAFDLTGSFAAGRIR